MQPKICYYKEVSTPHGLTNLMLCIKTDDQSFYILQKENFRLIYLCIQRE